MLRECDLVMKGGVTSGVVYPPAIYAITREFDLRSIGGTSAGAIAAALAAAAQYRRVADTATPEAGYEALLAVPDWLGRDRHLFGLFTPNGATRSLFDTVVALAAPGRSQPQRFADLLKAYGGWASVGAIPGLMHLLFANRIENRTLRGLNSIAATAGLVAGAGAAATLALVADTLRRLPPNEYGLVTGIDDTRENPDTLCTWLATKTEEIAGLPITSLPRVPLTFGMLWNPQRGAIANGEKDLPSEATVDLKMMTTAIVEGRPYLFPTNTSRYHFRDSEMRRFFPPHVVEWLVQHARPSEHNVVVEGEMLAALPPIGDLPILVATRMSLAFPILLSAVPFYVIEHGIDGSLTAQRVLFSDGGITSNFPIALFDSPLPSRPTLAINLGGFPPGVPDDKRDIVMATDNRPLAIYPSNPVGSLPSFGGAIFGTLQNWNDALLARLPGYRDRIVTVRLHDSEGGLNLDMDAKTIAGLVDRGRRAGEMLVQRFGAPSTLAPMGDPTTMGWENQRWVRYRAIMSELRDLLAKFADHWTTPHGGDVPYKNLVLTNDADTIPHHSYRLPNDADVREKVATLSEALAALGEELAAQQALAYNEPKP
ncbi:MAG: patatin-like phospholipase family protein, partial [Candidatus Baltobacteraceae bacterium]